ncbi:hypothetical protein [Streptomyces sp. ALI-76-A]|jgi:hypothetical protein|uniref:hypothetical protein n=1 Tax=Streptomyces sp. ALI-76-A TaxID=3025736 RepID=UPI00256E9A98|nr:hypothetical protein [Streptomyces sp. ALI-76-A]MDL5202312.1 hypothetical protein [Streptomyces sp. ALI-76-A]
MSWDQNARDDVVVPPMPPGPPPAPADPWRAVAVASLNLSGLGLGYALVRRWRPAAVCWGATAAFLFAGLPADPDGVPAALVVVYLAFLVFAAAHGAFVGLRTPMKWPPSPLIAAALGVVLLAVPATGVVLYDDARDEATEQMLLDRLGQADETVRTVRRMPFATAKADYREALAVYDGLSEDHPGSRAAERVPDRLRAFYAAVASPYTEKSYCAAIEPLKYLRTVPRTVREKDLGSLSTWPDDRLATSLYGCAEPSLSGGTGEWTSHFGELLTLFPESEQARKVEPAVRGEVDKAVKSVGGDEPCAAVTRLESLGTQADSLPAERARLADALGREADRARENARTGTYACGVDQYRDKQFGEAVTTMNDFVESNPGHRNQARARKIAIAAEVAQTIPAAGKRLPTTASGGSISVTVKNDSPDDITVLYTGPVTGSFTLQACGGCTSYSLGSTLGLGFEPCSDSGRNYPQRTIQLPVGTTYFVHKSQSGLGKSPASDTAKLSPGYIYTECAYTTTLGY